MHYTYPIITLWCPISRGNSQNLVKTSGDNSLNQSPMGLTVSETLSFIQTDRQTAFSIVLQKVLALEWQVSHFDIQRKPDHNLFRCRVTGETVDLQSCQTRENQVTNVTLCMAQDRIQNKLYVDVMTGEKFKLSSILKLLVYWSSR